MRQIIINSEKISEVTVSLIKNFYKIVISSSYFILSNILLLMSLFVFRLSISNIWFYIGPIFLLMSSFMLHCKVQVIGIENMSFKKYFSLFKRTILNYKLDILKITLIFLLILLNLSLVTTYEELYFLLIPSLITISFVVNGVLYYIKLTVKEKKSIDCLTAILISYSSVKSFTKNLIITILTIFITIYISPIITLLIGELLLRLYFKNIEYKI